MDHRTHQRSLGRVTAHRKAMLRNLATALILRESVVTTEAKAKEVRRFVEPLITKAKTTSIPARRQLAAILPESGAVDKLVADIGPKYKDRPGGYVRLIKLGNRGGDGARTVKVELV